MSDISRDVTTVAGRSCDSCHLCCKVFPIREVGKVGFAHCDNLEPGVGCRIYETRPQTCREFFCLWMLDASLGEEWQPCRAGFVLHDPVPYALLASVDVERPDSWRQEPYVADFRIWAHALTQGQHLVGVRCGDHTTLLIKDREIDIDG